MNVTEREFNQKVVWETENKMEAERSLQKEKEKTARQEEYEEKIKEALEELSRLTMCKEWTEAREKVEENLNAVQNMAFMEGYLYAIAVLEESLVHMK
ncbi:hypothetical protein AALA98_10890 [Lachnospiraceae bacterium 45-W7]